MAWSGYKSRRWRRMRLVVLRRDGYRCRESARYGKRVEATTVHHVWPAEDYPEYASLQGEERLAASIKFVRIEENK